MASAGWKTSSESFSAGRGRRLAPCRKGPSFGPHCFQLGIDSVYGTPGRAFFASITRKELAMNRTETRYVQVGDGAGATISLPAAVLRSASVTIMGTAGIPPRNVLAQAIDEVM